MGEGIKDKQKNTLIEKTLAMSMLEFLKALQILADAIQGIRQGKSYPIITISNQLRSLLIEKDQKKAVSLLFHIALQFDVTTKIFCGTGTDEENPPFDPFVHISGFPVSINKQHKIQKEQEFEGFLEQKLIYIEGLTYSSSDLIRWYANWLGGAHYSKKIPKDFYNLLSFNQIVGDILGNYILQLGEITLSLGIQILKKVCDFEIHLLLAVPEQNAGSDSKFLLDFYHPETPMRITFGLTSDLRPFVRINGLQNYYAELVLKDLMDWSKPRYLYIKYSISNNLETNLEIFVDGVSQGLVQVKEPIFIWGNIHSYHRFMNRAKEAGNKDFNVGIGQLLINGGELDQFNRANLLLYLKERLDSSGEQYLFFSNESFGESPVNERDFHFKGSVTRKSSEEILNFKDDRSS